MTVAFGSTELPTTLTSTLRKAVRVEWITIGFLIVAVVLVYLVLGNSQAMKVAWVEDLLSLAPPISFLLAVRISRKRPTVERPYGFHRSIGVAHLVSGTALLVVGSFLVFDSGSVLLKAEHPPIGSVELFGQVFWLGWLMIGTMVATGIPPVLLGRVKLKLAEPLHDKVLYADAKMNKADWMTAASSIVGVTGIGFGLWWADAAAALFISVNILRDGLTNMRAAIKDLMDARATTVDGAEALPLIEKANACLRDLDWVQDAGSRMRDQGHVLHVEAFVVPRSDADLSLEALEQARSKVRDLDWKMQDVVLVPVHQLPEYVRP